MSTSAVPAAPTGRNPLLRRSSVTGTQLSHRCSVSEIQVFFLGLTPVTAATAVMLAGCGVQRFVVVDPRPATWEDAVAGAFDVPDVGLPRDLHVRRRIRAANSCAAPVADPEIFPSHPVQGAVIVYSADTSTGETGGGSVNPGDNGSGVLEATASRLAEAHPVITVAEPPGHPPGTTVVWPVRPWHARPCHRCLTRAAGVSGSEPSRGPRHDAWPTHTAWAAAVVAQHALATGAGTLPTDPTSVTVLRPGAPLSRMDTVPDGQGTCALCAATWPLRS